MVREGRLPGDEVDDGVEITDHDATATTAEALVPRRSRAEDQ